MNYFESITQYDKQFDCLQNFKFDKNACYIFAFLTAQQFMIDGIINNVHEHNRIVELSALNHESLNMEGQKDFLTVMSFTDLTGQPNITSVELINENIIGFDNMFDESKTEPYCVVFLKNSKFFTVMVTNDCYAIRDCHEMNQYNFETKEGLIQHLKQVYQFCNKIDLGGDYDLSDFSNVEFLIIDKPVNTCFDLLLEKQQFEVDYFDFNDNQNNSHKDDDFFV